MKVTNYMINKWTRAGFLIIFGIVLLIYLERLVEELHINFERLTDSSSEPIFTFLTAVLYIFTLWLFVAAALNILSGFKEPRVSLEDLNKKLDDIEKRLPEVQKPIAPVTEMQAAPVVPTSPKVPEVPKVAEEELPPPPPESPEKL